MKLFLISSLLSGYSREVLLLCHWTQGTRGVLLWQRYLTLPTAWGSFVLNVAAIWHVGGLPLITCMGNCQPRRTFHSKCVPKLQRTDQNFKCLVCRPADREDFCFCCNGPATQDIILCGAHTLNGCHNFIHRFCLAKGHTEYQCGLC